MPNPPPPETAADVLRAARAVAAEDAERAAVATYLRLEPGAGDARSPEGELLADRVRTTWDVLLAADPDVTVQDVLAVLGDLDLRPTPARAPDADAGPTRLAAWRPTGTPLPARAARDAETTAVRDAFVGGRLLRVVNHHDTPLVRAAEIHADLAWYAERFAPVTAADVHAFLDTGRWPDPRPGIVPAFYDGFASAVQVALPALDDLGLVGWFYPPTAFLDVPAARQREFARAHEYGVLDVPDGPLAMTWDELADLSTRHEVCGHTATHAASADVRDADAVRAEVTGPLRRLTEVIGRPPAAWAWLGGTDPDPDAPGDRAVLDAGVRLWTSNTTLRRVG
ncbi:hypothetical protein [Kineococcus rhizosphaerae]|uniref:Polysaccharide deacetylase n=1 Tax=Kineococcus rhizosphaerae TaxID=559628 RepID=A0A2T0R3C7_9ACTN|nr:hypothetical protein [Kineococcus rhizosphaerae]PRY14559.1 hypothetical protein CLV37_106117 [Kineococcus rhizosphaerae]